MQEYYLLSSSKVSNHRVGGIMWIATQWSKSTYSGQSIDYGFYTLYLGHELTTLIHLSASLPSDNGAYRERHLNIRTDKK